MGMLSYMRLQIKPLEWVSMSPATNSHENFRHPASGGERGFKLVELLITVAIAGVLAAVAYPSYTYYLNRSKVTTAKADILRFQFALERAYSAMNAYPATLDKIADPPNDPWGNPYQYLPMEGASVGQKRKDKSLHPLNTDYDLYSMGADGKTATPLTAKASRDDIIRANNGGYVGLGEDY